MTTSAMLSANEKEGKILSFTAFPKIHCGLRWDAPTIQGAESVDIDLCCALYDEYGSFIDMVSGKIGQRISQGGSVYHLGDDADGSEDGDDEKISLDLFSMPRDVHFVFLFCEIQSRQTFAEVIKPYIRITDQRGESVLMEAHLGDRDGGGDRAFLLARLQRKDSGWHLVRIGQYAGGLERPEWPRLLMSYLPRELANKDKANLPSIPQKGESVPLFYTKQSRHRVVCGLSWDSSGDRKLGTFDLDLTCVLFDAQGGYLDYVSSLASKTVAEDGAVYHTGDNESGAGEGDDEQVSVELLRLPEDVHHVVFVVDAKSKHKLGQVHNPNIRIADGMTNRNQLKVVFGKGVDKSGYIFARITRDGEDWSLHLIDEYVDTESMEDWVDPITPYLGS